MADRKPGPIQRRILEEAGPDGRIDCIGNYASNASIDSCERNGWIRVDQRCGWWLTDAGRAALDRCKETAS